MKKAEVFRLCCLFLLQRTVEPDKSSVNYCAAHPPGGSTIASIWLNIGGKKPPGWQSPTISANTVSKASM